MITNPKEMSNAVVGNSDKIKYAKIVPKTGFKNANEIPLDNSIFFNPMKKIKIPNPVVITPIKIIQNQEFKS